MLGKTHKIIAKNILVNIKQYDFNIIDQKDFIKGNLKPDKISTYKLKKHYKDESFNMIINKICYLSSLSEEEIIKNVGKKKFNQELGVVCHFLTDYFSLAHEERWEFKHKFKSHVNYEIVLGKISETYKFDTTCFKKDLDIVDIGRFVNDTLEEYKKVKGFEADIIFAQYVCNSVVISIIKNIKLNNTVSIKMVI